MGREHASRENKLSMVIFLIFVQKNVSTIRFQEIKIRPLKGFEKMRFFVFLAVQDSSIGDIDSQWVSQSLTRVDYDRTWVR